MSSNQWGIPKGTRDFGPETMAKRQYIFSCIAKVYKKFGFLPLETPSMEQLSVLTGKYGDEGDQLIFKVLNSGDYLKKTNTQDYELGSAAMLPKISEKGLRYDLTVPFARYVVNHRNDITLPFKRYQMQPVWRADRPQKGRYREFFQCDADVVGTDSLLCEAEIIAMINEVFHQLGIDDYSILINHRQILKAMSEAIGTPGQESALAVSLDKISKIGWEQVAEDLQSKGFDPTATDLLEPMTQWQCSVEQWPELQQTMQQQLGDSSAAKKGLDDLDETFAMLSDMGYQNPHIRIDATLARGLSYYTGTIFEVVVNNVQIGSVSGGGRYDDLTGVFGMPGISGVGISFGVDRLYDVMEELKLFPEEQLQFTKVLIIPMGSECKPVGLQLLSKLRGLQIATELYPDQVKFKKSMGYANKKGIPLVVLIGSDELASGSFTLKNMSSGKQETFEEADLIKSIQNL